MEAFLRRDLRNLIPRNPCAVIAGNLAHNRIVCNKGENQLVEACRNAILLQKLLIGNAFRDSFIADTVNSVNGSGVIVIAGHLIRVHIFHTPCHCSNVLLAVRAAHHGEIVPKRNAIPGDAAHIFSPGDITPGRIVANHSDGITGDAACVIPAAVQRSVIGILRGQSHLHVTRDAAAVIASGMYRSAVCAAVDDAFCPENIIQRGISCLVNVRFRIQIVFHADHTGNSADIGIALYVAIVRAGSCPALIGLGDIFIGYILHRIIRILILHIIGSIPKSTHDGIELIGNRPKIGNALLRLLSHGIAEGLDLCCQLAHCFIQIVAVVAHLVADAADFQIHGGQCIQRSGKLRGNLRRILKRVRRFFQGICNTGDVACILRILLCDFQHLTERARLIPKTIRDIPEDSVNVVFLCPGIKRIGIRPDIRSGRIELRDVIRYRFILIAVLNEVVRIVLRVLVAVKLILILEIVLQLGITLAFNFRIIQLRIILQKLRLLLSKLRGQILQIACGEIPIREGSDGATVLQNAEAAVRMINFLIQLIQGVQCPLQVLSCRLRVRIVRIFGKHSVHSLCRRVHFLIAVLNLGQCTGDIFSHLRLIHGGSHVIHTGSFLNRIRKLFRAVRDFVRTFFKLADVLVHRRAVFVCHLNAVQIRADRASQRRKRVLCIPKISAKLR